jgi:hypothetical protein
MVQKTIKFHLPSPILMNRPWSKPGFTGPNDHGPNLAFPVQITMVQKFKKIVYKTNGLVWTRKSTTGIMVQGSLFKHFLLQLNSMINSNTGHLRVLSNTDVVFKSRIFFSECNLSNFFKFSLFVLAKNPL